MSTSLPLPRKSAFTLIELLVVIAITAVLASILMPSLRRAREVALELRCMNQIRQTAIGVLAYVTDFKDDLPPHFAKTNGGTFAMYQASKAPDTMWAYWGGGGTAPYKLRAGLTYPDYIPDARIFYCPESAYGESGIGRRWDMKPANSPPTGNEMGFKWFGKDNAYSGQHDTDYSFPAVNYGRITQTNYGGSDAPTINLWTTTNYWQSYSKWGISMLHRKATTNAGSHYPMLWDASDGSGMYHHNLRVTNIGYFDGAALKYPQARHVYMNYSHDIYGARGFRNPAVLTWLQRFKTEGYLLP